MNRRPAPGLPTAPPTPRPTAPGEPLTTEEALAWTPTEQDQADFEAYQCGDDFPDVPDQPLITCDREGTTKFLLYLAVINGDMVTDAQAGIPQNQVNLWIVTLDLNDEGGRIFEQVTGVLAQKTEPQNTFAIVLDSKVVTYPRLDPAIPGGNAEISGDFTQQTATDLANVLKYGSLPLAFDLSEVSNVSPTLGGEQAAGRHHRRPHRSGARADLLGDLLPGAVDRGDRVADPRRHDHVPDHGAAGQSMGFALNLPGIAGAIVAIGMTADSFIIYFAADPRRGARRPLAAHRHRNRLGRLPQSS